MRLDLQSKGGGGEGAHDRVPPHHGGLYIRDHRTDAVEPRRADVQRDLVLADDAVLVESGRSLPMHGEAGRHHAFRRPGRQSGRIDAVEGELDVPDRGLLQGGGQLPAELAASGIERRLRRNHLDVFRPHDQLANPDLAGPPGEVPGSVRYEAALAELRAEGLERDRPGRSGALERRIEIQGDRRCSLSGQLRGKP